MKNILVSMYPHNSIVDVQSDGSSLRRESREAEGTGALSVPRIR